MHDNALSLELKKNLDFLMAQESLAPFSLGGGTSLAIRFGHRMSVDLDWFTPVPFNSLVLHETLRSWYPGLEVVNRTPGSLCCIADGIKLDFLLHAYPRLQEDAVVDGRRLLSLPDIAAMKINAVTNRGSRKDFSDLLLLHKAGGISLSDSLEYFCKKYGDAGRALALRSLIWFDDAEEEPDPVFLNGWTWSEVRQSMTTLGQNLCREHGL